MIHATKAIIFQSSNVSVCISRFCLAIEDMCNSLIHSQSSAFLIRGEDGKLIVPSTPGGKEIGAKDMQLAEDVLQKQELTDTIVSSLERNGSAGEMIEPIHLVCVPIHHPIDQQGNLIGVLSAQRKAFSQISPGERRVLLIVSQRLAMMVNSMKALQT